MSRTLMKMDTKYSTASNGHSSLMNGNSNYNSVTMNNLVSNDLYSLWSTGTITSPSKSTSSDVSVTDDAPLSQSEPKTQSAAASEASHPRLDSLLGPYSKPPGLAGVVMNQSYRYTDYPRQFTSCVQRPPARAPLHGFNWNAQQNSVSGFMTYGIDANNNVIARPTWNIPRPVSSPFCSTPLPVPSLHKTAPNYFIAKKNGERVFKTKANFVGTGTVSINQQPAVDRPKRIHVSNIPFWMTENDLLILFKDYGTVQEVQVITNEKGSKGFGFVTFKKTSEADQAKTEMDGAVVDGRVIEVNDAHPKNHNQKKPLLSKAPTSETSF